MKRLSFVLLSTFATASVAQAASLSHNTHARSGLRGVAPAGSATSISQMTDNTPVSGSGGSCNDAGGSDTTLDNSWWRRFYFNEYNSPGSAVVDSVTIAIEAAPPTPVTINLYTIPHSAAVDTITLEDLTLIGSGSACNDGSDLQALTIPVAATITDAQSTDLVVEYHIDGSDGLFFPGANASPETHPSFFSSSGCGLDEPLTVSDAGLPDMHTVVIVNLGSTGPGAPLLSKAFAPSTVSVGAPSTLTITLSNQSQPGAATLGADLTDTLPAGLLVAATPNASTTCPAGTVTATAGSSSVSLSAGAQIPASATCTVTVDVSAAANGVFNNTLAAGALQTDLGNNHEPAQATLVVFTSGPSTFPPDENFDENAAPSLPAGWVSSNMTGPSDWTTTSSASDTAPYAAFAPEMGEVSDFTLDTPVFTAAANQTVTFHHQFNLEGDTELGGTGLDGAVLEVSIGGGEFTDIVTAGGSFETGGYIKGINPTLGSPLSGRDAWTGNSGGFITSTALLPASAAGQPTQLRFRTASDNSGTADGVTGWWVDSIHLDVRTPGNPPSATVTPTSLTFSVPYGQAGYQTLSIANAAGSDPLTYTVMSRHLSERPKLIPYTADTSATKQAGELSGSQLVSSLARRLAEAQREASRALPPWLPADSVVFQLDDGSPERFNGFGTFGDPPTEAGVVWLNRFTATDAQTIDSISIYWGTAAQTGGSMQGLQANLVVYYDADGDGDPTNALRIGSDDLVTITTLGDFETYPTNFAIPAAGDVYIGFVDQWAIDGGYVPKIQVGATDRTNPLGKSYLSGATFPPTDITNLANNDQTGALDDIASSLAGNLLIRATGTGGSGGSAPCTAATANWLQVLNPMGSGVAGGDSTDIGINAAPFFNDLGPGTYTAQLCITTNDPAQPLVVVPVSMIVTPVPCSGDPDEIFCNGFEGPEDDGKQSGSDPYAAADSHATAFDGVKGKSVASPGSMKRGPSQPTPAPHKA
jgi:hypothetical protein